MAANLYASAVNSVFTLEVRCVEDQKTVTSELSPGQSATPGSAATGGPDAWNWARGLSGYFGAVALGSKSINVTYQDGPSTAFATGTITFTGNLSNSDTITVAGVTATGVTGTPSGSQFKIGATQAATMANLIAFVNANGSANNFIGLISLAQTSANVLTMTSDYPGLVGNLITTSKSAANISAITSPLAGGSLTTQPLPISIGI